MITFFKDRIKAFSRHHTSTRSHVKTRLVAFVLHVARTHTTHIIEYFCEDGLVHRHPSDVARTVFFYLKETVVSNVKRRTKLVTRVLRSVAIEVA